MRRTKIVCTLGPAVDKPEMLQALILAGMDVARLNFSHGTQAEQEARFHAVRAASQTVGKPVAVLQDLCGPKIRVGSVAKGTRLRRDASFTLTLNAVPGNEEIVHLPIREMHAAVTVGNHLLLDDGLLELVVTGKTDTDLITRVIHGGTLSSKKGISAPGVCLDVEAVTDKDEDDVRFGLRLGVDLVALSFVRHAGDVLRLRRVMEEEGKSAPIIVKIEKADALENLEEILKVSDGAMVARGDMGVEMDIEIVPMAQKRIIKVCNLMGKPVITATQMLDSMIRNPRPTRAEVTDIANAVLDGTDALMLSGETAVGAFPTESVEMMGKVALQAEENGVDWERWLAEKHPIHGRESVTDAIGEAVATIAHDQKATAILCSTTSGATARTVSKYRPQAPILAATTEEATFRQMSLLWGVTPMLVPFPQNTDQMIEQTIDAAKQTGHVSDGDLVVITAGTPIGVVGSTNLVKVHRVGQPLTAPTQEL